MTNYNYSKKTYLKFSIWPLKINCENPVYKRRIQMLEFLFTSILFRHPYEDAAENPCTFRWIMGFMFARVAHEIDFLTYSPLITEPNQGRHKIHVYCPSFQRWFSIFASVAFCIRLGLFADLLMMLNWLPKLARNTLGD